MHIDNPRFKPEDLFKEAHWGEVKPPIKRYKARPAPKGVRKALSRQFGELVLPILKGKIRGAILPEGSVYNPSDPNFGDLAQHFPGAVLLVDREYIAQRSERPGDYVKTLPLEEDQELELQLPSRQFVTHNWKGSYTSATHARLIWHNGMLYCRSVKVEALALQSRSSTPVAYHTMPFPVDRGNIPVWRHSISEPAERIGTSYEGIGGGLWRTTMVEICQEGSAVEVSAESIIRLGNLAME